MSEQRCECCDLPVYSCGKAAQAALSAEDRASWWAFPDPIPVSYPFARVPGPPPVSPPPRTGGPTTCACGSHWLPQADGCGVCAGRGEHAGARCPRCRGRRRPVCAEACRYRVPAQALAEVAQWWAELVADLVPGSARRWSQREPGGEWTACSAHPVPVPVVLGGDGRRFCPHPACAFTHPIGESPAPLVLAVEDAATGVLDGLVELADAVREHLGLPRVCWCGHNAEAHWADTRAGAPRRGGCEGCPCPGWRTSLRHPPTVATWLVAQLPRLSGDVAQLVREESLRVVGLLRAAAGTAEPVAPLAAPCPICSARSLWVWQWAAEVRCVNPGCVCELASCDCQRGGRHVWLPDDWPWLARVLGCSVADLAAA